MATKTTLKDQGFFKDRDGRVVLWQWPNVPLIGWILCKILSLLISNPHLHHGLELLSTALLFTWAYLELFSGVNYFRRLMGLIVLIAIVASFFTL